MDAESQARETAFSTILDGRQCLALEFCQAREEGNPLTAEEKTAASFAFNSAFRDKRRELLQEYILSGQVRDCILSRQFMANNY